MIIIYRFFINLIFLAPNKFRYFFVSKVEGKHKLNLLKIFFEKKLINFHFLNVFFVILAFSRTIGIFFL